MAVQENVDVSSLTNVVQHSNIVSISTLNANQSVACLPSVEGTAANEQKVKPVFQQMTQAKIIQAVPVSGVGTSQTPIFRIIKNPGEAV